MSSAAGSIGASTIALRRSSRACLRHAASVLSRGIGEHGVDPRVELVALHVLDVIEERHAEPGRHGDAVEVGRDDLAQVAALVPYRTTSLARIRVSIASRGSSGRPSEVDVPRVRDPVSELGDLGLGRLAQRHRGVGDLVVDDLAVEPCILVARLLVARVGDAPGAGAQVDVRQRRRERGRQDPGDRRDVRIAS